MNKCPSCDRRFDTHEGVGKHHSRVHADEWEKMFWYYVNKNADGDCWEWWGRKANGYGSFKRDNVRYYAHRLSYRMRYGVIPKPQINHHCDNTVCVNPDHLYSGTQKENVNDAWNRSGREGMKSGLESGWESASENVKQAWEDGKMINPEDSSFAKLNRSQVEEIKYEVNRDGGAKAVANKYSVSANAIRRIWREDTWKDV